MIVAAAWFTAEHCGVVAPGGRSLVQSSPSLASSDDMLAFIGRPVKYYSRMTSESRCALGAAHLALNATGWTLRPSPEIGLLAAGYDGCLQADKAYFRDYLASGRTMGRGNLFIYTLPTSTLGEIAIALSLTGPSLHIQEDKGTVAAIVKHAEQLVADREADGMLCLWSDPQAAVCLAIDTGFDPSSLDHLIRPGAQGSETSDELERTPLELTVLLRRMVGGS